MKKGSKSEKRSGISGSKVAGSNKIHQLFENQLKDLYWAEKELTTFMPKLVENISSQELIDTLREHMEMTKKQVTRLENVFELIGSKASAERCPAMAGLIEEAETIVKESSEGEIRDAFIIGAVQKVEHYEMASYGTLKAIASLIGEYEVASLLGETLEEEKEADLNLTDVAENIVNVEASIESGDLESDEDDVEDEDDEYEAEEEDTEDILDEEEEMLGTGRGRSGLKSKPGSRRAY